MKSLNEGDLSMYKDLVQYTASMGYITILSAVIMVFYLEFDKNKLDKSEKNTWKLISARVTISFGTTWIASKSYATATIAVCSCLLMEFVAHIAKNTDSLLYEQFREKLYDFIESEIESLGKEEFYKRYPIQKWLTEEK